MAADAPTAFFSYCREDSDFALRLPKDLKARRRKMCGSIRLDIAATGSALVGPLVEDALKQLSWRLLVILSPVFWSPTTFSTEVSFGPEGSRRPSFRSYVAATVSAFPWRSTGFKHQLVLVASCQASSSMSWPRPSPRCFPPPLLRLRMLRRKPPFLHRPRR